MMGFVDLLWLLLFALTGAFAVQQSLRLFGTWFSPLSLFIGINCASVCLYHLRLLGMIDVSVVTHAIVWTSLLGFGVGSHLGYHRAPPPPASLRTSLDSRGLGAFFYGTAFICTFGWIVAATIMVTRHGGVGQLVANLWMLQNEFQMQGIGYLNMIGIVVLPTFIVKCAVGDRRPLDVLFVASALFGLMLAGIKAFVFYSALSSVVTWSLVFPERFRPRHLLMVTALLIVFFVAYNSVVDIFASGIVTAGSGWFASLTQLHWPYLYAVGAWPAMENIVDGKLAPPAAVGAVTLNAMYKVLGDFLGLVPSVPFAQEFTDIGATTFNVYSIFGVLYQEWTWPGAVLITVLLGFVSTRLYLRARRAGYWGHVVAYGLFGYGLFMSCFMYVFRFNMMLLLLYLYAFGFVVLRGGVLVDRRGRD